MVCVLEVQYRSNLVTDSHQQQPPLCAVNRDLPDEFVEALGVQLLSDGADAGFAGLALLQPFVKFLLEVQDILLGGGGGGY
jgi:hypothetical protein